MQEALNNPHYKKIWETVIRNRHPEVKYEDKEFCLKRALDKELKYFGCFIKFTKYTLVKASEQKEIKFLTVGSKKYADTVTLNPINYYNGGLPNFDYHLKQNEVITILGRQITLEDILQLQANPQSFSSWDKEHIEQGTLVYANGMIMLGLPSVSTYINLDDSINGNCFCVDWQLTKPLHEQTPETWEKIAELI